MVLGMRTRKSVNCLAHQVQEYVNCDSASRKARLRQEFHGLYDRVFREKLYMKKNFKKLQRLLAMKQYQSDHQQQLMKQSTSSATISSMNSAALLQQAKQTISDIRNERQSQSPVRSQHNRSLK